MARTVVLGAGVLGLTVASVLRLAGQTVRIVAKERIADRTSDSDPLFASAYPAASIIPHSVGSSPETTDLVRSSEVIFDSLRDYTFTGVRLQKHFEVFENQVELPKYHEALRNFQMHELGSSKIPIARLGAKRVSAMSFDCFFCNMPVYGPWLRKFVTSLGIPFEARQLTHEWLTSLSETDLVVNCLGSRAWEVYPDIQPGLLYRGILIMCPFPELQREVISYNYTPIFEVFPGFAGKPSDVYFYPRTRHCVLGGTRQPGKVNRRTGLFVADEELPGSLIEIDGVSVPKAILELNRELISQLTAVTIEGPFTSRVGYRHVDGTAECPRTVIELRERRGLPVHVDCFGFGGAGVTLSWGAALRVLDIATKATAGLASSLGSDSLAHVLADHLALSCLTCAGLEGRQ